MVIQGLVKKGYRKLAREIALNHYNEVLEVYKNTGTFWEYYSPEKAEPGFMARKEFVGWSGLPPIAELIEFIIGIRGDYSKQQIVWDMNLTEANGIEEYVTTSFPEDGRISFGCYVRPSIFVVCRFQGIRNEIRFLASFNRQKAFCIKSCRGNH